MRGQKFRLICMHALRLYRSSLTVRLVRSTSSSCSCSVRPHSAVTNFRSKDPLRQVHTNYMPTSHINYCERLVCGQRYLRRRVKKNEDETLKKAVERYGTSKWARVASLLPRKSIKQCIARWYEWLHPTINLAEWSREEEEKLLHHAKLMPLQWQAIADIVGRTAAQCLYHYERLLDAAQKKNSVVVSDDPRRLRPGEIDPSQEGRLAWSDPVDVDEDKKEVLSDAQARLASTKGKKDKMKNHETQHEEARGLKVLPKKRDIEMAGLLSSSSSVDMKKRKIDRATKIPFEKKASAGLCDVLEVKRFANKMDEKCDDVKQQKVDDGEVQFEQHCNYWKKNGKFFHATKSAGSTSNSGASKKESEACQGSKSPVDDFKLHPSNVRSNFTAPPTSFSPRVARSRIHRHSFDHGNWRGGFQSSGASSRASFLALKTECRTHYEVLGIDKTATSDQVKRSYHKLARVYHPDKSKVMSHADLFKDMTAAYSVLSDKSARDAQLSASHLAKVACGQLEPCLKRDLPP
uniref:DnaJ homolog subfamily C member 2 n=1 Tax=Peronospora matthiolae TaxID=2874970 RepID=A0AAV1UKN0_9STRA